ncbi:MAG: acyl transferase [Bacteroidetes bacterium]|nr:acyl transferase [Bacteroidota bacterium]
MENKIFNILSDREFDELAMDIFRFQSENNEVYKSYIRNLSINPGEINSISEIPFLPVEFFKTHDVCCSPEKNAAEPVVFTSSGTTGSETSRHTVLNISLYENGFRKAFEIFYGPVSGYCILALLPSYLERKGSSLIYMADDLGKNSRHPRSGFYLDDHDELSETLRQLQRLGQKTILLGVTYALLDFAEKHKMNFPELIIMETGGMKGRRKEIIRSEVHQILCARFGVKKIHSEYGMTELLSQAYSTGDGVFRTPPWMKILIREMNDPFTPAEPNQNGCLNVIDLANLYSCSFIATNDLGKTHGETFEVTGRYDNSDIRGCNLMVL